MSPSELQLLQPFGPESLSPIAGYPLILRLMSPSWHAYSISGHVAPIALTHAYQSLFDIQVSHQSGWKSKFFVTELNAPYFLHISPRSRSPQRAETCRLTSDRSRSTVPFSSRVRPVFDMIVVAVSLLRLQFCPALSMFWHVAVVGDGVLHYFNYSDRRPCCCETASSQ